MRKESASIIALAALGLAEELKPNDVPLACANICGPIVELSVMCDMDGTTQVQELKRRKLAHVPRTLPQGQKKAKRQVVPPQTSGPRTTRSMGQFKTIPFSSVPAEPTTPPNAAQPVQVEPNIADGAVANPPIINLRPTNTPTVINPLFPDLIGPSTPAQPSVAPTPSFSSIGTTTTSGGGGANLPVGNGGASPTGGSDLVDGPADGDAAGGAGDGTTGDVTDDVGSIRDDAGMLWPGQKQKQEEENREKLCFCQNKSFDVARVAGLCASCINQMGDDKNPIDSVITMCNFTVEEYQPALDSVAVGVKVKLVSAAGGRPTVGILAVGVALGLVGLAEALL